MPISLRYRTRRALRNVDIEPGGAIARLATVCSTPVKACHHAPHPRWHWVCTCMFILINAEHIHEQSSAVWLTSSCGVHFMTAFLAGLVAGVAVGLPVGASSDLSW